jgi:CubicO group peptidase (beta-lactamase class C family)
MRLARDLSWAVGVGLLHGCGITDHDLKLAYGGYAPESIDDGWVVSTPEEEGLDAATIDEVYRELFMQDRYPTAQGLLIVRHGRLVAEAYVRDAGDRDRPHHLQSATKSITALLTGIARDQGLLHSVHTPLHDIIPHAFDDDPAKRAITVFHALTMQTGLEFDNDVNTVRLVHSGGSSLEYVLHRELVFTPGSEFYYHDGNPQLVSGVIQTLAGMSEDAFADRYLFGPLGIEDYRWERHSDGLTFGAFGLWLKPRDMAKIGLMLARDGVFEERRVVSSEWIEEATTPHTRLGDYGYYFWLFPDGAFRAEGHGGQVIHVVQADDLVVVLTADPYSDTAALSPGLYGLIDRVAAAVR